MDTLHRTSRYQQLSSNLHKLATGSEKDAASYTEDVYTSILEEVNQIIESLRNRGDQDNAKAHYVIITALLATVLVWHSIVTGRYITDLMVLFLLIAFLFIAQYRMKQVISIGQQSTPKKLDGVQNKKEYISLKMRYLHTVINIKKARLLLVAIGYIIFSPITLVKLHVAALGTTPFDSIKIAYLIAYILAGTLWFIYFNRSFEIYDDIEKTIEFISDKLKVLS